MWGYHIWFVFVYQLKSLIQNCFLIQNIQYNLNLCVENYKRLYIIQKFSCK